ncbi:FAD-dependent oxidoreductase [Streptomyces nigrescens]|uniref:FAD-dependent oxidoreductase n=1 Tax=Streptomyces nigrescens TaxID=1920 RepID=A0ABM7ZX88_STRNI|nr:FAD-dependent monooxygenase [Streptomyces nigrescens]BDM70983.1 FAD-dependent oxidoreductase [Streptomyces nigrescens]
MRPQGRTAGHDPDGGTERGHTRGDHGMSKALIIGGGIAGTVTAMALHKAGIEAEVFEAYPSGADDVGAFLVVFANGLEALRVIDAHDPVAAHSFPARRIAVFGHDGTKVAERPIAGSGTGPGPRTLRRATLYQVLHAEAARRGIPVHHGKRLVGAETVASAGGKRVVAAFADGSRAEGDLLIGADGLHSVTRTLIDPAAPRPRHTGQHTVCGYTRATGAEPAAETYTMIRGDRAVFGCTRAPDDEIWWFANIPGAESDRTALQAVGPGEWRDRVAARFPGDATPAAALVRATGDRVIVSSAYDIATTPTWYDDTKVVLGDAAHAAAPNAAQGASMAIEDGIVLARCLRDHTDPRTAFAAYEKLRRERVEKVVAASAGLAARTGPQGPGRPATGPAGGGADGSDWLTDYRIEW